MTATTRWGEGILPLRLQLHHNFRFQFFFQLRLDLRYQFRFQPRPGFRPGIRLRNRVRGRAGFYPGRRRFNRRGRGLGCLHLLLAYLSGFGCPFFLGTSTFKVASHSERVCNSSSLPLNFFLCLRPSTFSSFLSHFTIHAASRSFPAPERSGGSTFFSPSS